MTMTKDRQSALHALLDELADEMRKATGEDPRKRAAETVEKMRLFELESLFNILFKDKHIERLLFLNDKTHQIFCVVKLHDKPLFGILVNDPHENMQMECLTKTALDIQIDDLEREGFIGDTDG